MQVFDTLNSLLFTRLRDETLLSRIKFLTQRDVVSCPLHVRLIYDIDEWLMNTMRCFVDPSVQLSKADLEANYNRYHSLLVQVLVDVQVIELL